MEKRYEIELLKLAKKQIKEEKKISLQKAVERIKTYRKLRF